MADRICVDCGKVMHNVHPAKQYCPECKEKRRRMLTAQWWQRKNEEIRSTRKKAESPKKRIQNAEQRDIEFRADCRAADKLGISYGKYMLQKMQADKKPAGAGTPTGQEVIV